MKENCLLVSKEGGIAGMLLSVEKAVFHKDPKVSTIDLCQLLLLAFVT